MAVKKTKTAIALSKPSIESRIKPIEELPTILAVLVYGRSGTGKTHFASTFPKPMLLIDVREAGTDTIAQVSGVDVLSVDKASDIEDLYWYLSKNPNKYKTVVIDQVTQMQDLAMAMVRTQENKEDDDLLTRREWGLISGWMKTWLFNFRDLIRLGMHVVFIAHDRSNNSDDWVEGQLDPSIGPRLMPSLAAAINGAVSVIGNTFIREKYIGQEKTRVVEYGLRIGPHAYFITKVRHPVEVETPEVIVNPNFDKLVSIVKGQPMTAKRVLKPNKGVSK